MSHQHLSPQRCDICAPWPWYARHLAAGINWLADKIDEQQTSIDRIEVIIERHHKSITRRLERAMTQASDNQSHIEQDVTAIGASVATAVQELKDQIAAGTQASALDFTSLDALAASTAAEASADAPPAPPA